MKAICSSNPGAVFKTVPKPDHAEPGHLLVKMKACGVNPGDKKLIEGSFPVGVQGSKHDIFGGSGAGRVIQVGDGVPESFANQNVAIYRSLVRSEHIVGTWSEYAHVHHLDCIILPKNLDECEYSASLVNIITAYAFYKQVLSEGHKGIISTAAYTATGIALIGICNAYHIPLISIVRNDEEKNKIERYACQNVFSQTDSEFFNKLKGTSHKLGTTAVFDGVGGAVLNQIIHLVPNNTTFYSYGFLGGQVPLTIHTSVLMKGIILKGFSNFFSSTVLNQEELSKALKDIEAIIHLPHFRTRVGAKFNPEDIKKALEYKGVDLARPVLYFE
ncbi:mitochondrial enoyl-[acyl-carrier protein] reductase [Acrasis kona]|uniref:Mitochondrial enoyl-[acyl-carrier protein] reductase n=1 Tax=Acrasis kona TaxID=1008807 RepID=A0AAW2ZFD7_9EUKA